MMENREVAVRYYSRSGNTKLAAEAIARAAGTDAVSVDAPSAPITEPVDVLFLGDALYAYGIDDHMKEFIRGLSRDKVRKAVVFSTSWISKHAIELIRSGLEEKGIPVAEEALYFRGKPGEKQQREAEDFARKFL
ncbi:MAG: flavodoxin [Lachnospiraceae bacterium]|nr:flavodoxin [Lachnospiraceae bacterium]